METRIQRQSTQTRNRGRGRKKQNMVQEHTREQDDLKEMPQQKGLEDKIGIVKSIIVIEGDNIGTQKPEENGVTISNLDKKPEREKMQVDGVETLTQNGKDVNHTINGLNHNNITIDNNKNNNNNNIIIPNGTMCVSPRRQRKSTQGIQDLLWEKEQLREINIRVDNIFNVFDTKIAAHQSEKGPLAFVDDQSLLNELREAQNKAMKEMADDFLNKVGRKNQELTDLKSALRNLEEKCNEVNTELNDLKEKTAQLKNENVNLKNDKNEAVRDKDRALTEIQDLKDTLEAQMKSFEGNRILYPETDQSKIEGQLHKQFAEKMGQMLQDRDDQYNQLKEQTEEMFRKQIEDAEERHGKQIQDLNNVIEGQKKELLDLQNDLVKLAHEREQLKRELDTEKPLRETVEDELKKQKEQAKEELKRARDRCDQLQADYRTMCDEHFTLEKMNLDLRAEIESLKLKLDTFEEQHKIESPVRAKKRRRTDASLMEPKVLSSVQGPLIQSYSEFPLDCVTRQYEGDWVGFELQNQWSKPIVLKGWSLSDVNQLSRLPLPEKKLNPKEIVRVCLTENKKEPTDLVWNGLTFKKGEKHELWVDDNLGFRHKIATISVPSNSVVTNAAGFVTETCLIM